jgi:hypothetical protein
MAILLHGTTRLRAEQIVATRPDPDAVEPSNEPKAFFCYRESCDYDVGTPEQYARDKAALFPDEGGPVILAVDVPDDIVALALDWFYTWEQGIIPFGHQTGLEELQNAWALLVKEIREVP